VKRREVQVVPIAVLLFVFVVALVVCRSVRV
jgi:hypothetical protein